MSFIGQNAGSAPIEGRKDTAADPPALESDNTVGKVAASLHDDKACGHRSRIDDNPLRV